MKVLKVGIDNYLDVEFKIENNTLDIKDWLKGSLNFIKQKIDKINTVEL